jgi:hypothetical protein
MCLTEGNIILVMHRRLFEKDESRFFLGRVDAYEAGIAKVTGHSFVRDILGGKVIEKMETRTKIFAIASGTLIVYMLPGDVAFEALRFMSKDGLVELTDGKKFCMNLTEHPHLGRV